jgi:hypothetical protein
MTQADYRRVENLLTRALSVFDLSGADLTVTDIRIRGHLVAAREQVFQTIAKLQPAGSDAVPMLVTQHS